MCGIAGLIWKGGVTSDIGTEMTQMLQALKHRGPDSTGYALYGKGEEGVYVPLQGRRTGRGAQGIQHSSPDEGAQGRSR